MGGLGTNTISVDADEEELDGVGGPSEFLDVECDPATCRVDYFREPWEGVTWGVGHVGGIDHARRQVIALAVLELDRK